MTTKTNTTKAKTVPRKRSFKDRRAYYAWWETYNAAIIGLCAGKGGNITLDPETRTHHVGQICIDAAAVADAAHGKCPEAP